MVDQNYVQESHNNIIKDGVVLVVVKLKMVDVLLVTVHKVHVLLVHYVKLILVHSVEDIKDVCLFVLKFPKKKNIFPFFCDRCA